MRLPLWMVALYLATRFSPASTELVEKNSIYILNHPQTPQKFAGRELAVEFQALNSAHLRKSSTPKLPYFCFSGDRTYFLFRLSVNFKIGLDTNDNLLTRQSTERRVNCSELDSMKCYRSEKSCSQKRVVALTENQL